MCRFNSLKSCKETFSVPSQIAALSFMYAIHAEKVYFTIIFFFSAIIGVCFFGIITVNTPLF